MENQHHGYHAYDQAHPAIMLDGLGEPFVGWKDIADEKKDQPVGKIGPPKIIRKSGPESHLHYGDGDREQVYPTAAMAKAGQSAYNHSARFTF